MAEINQFFRNEPFKKILVFEIDLLHSRLSFFGKKKKLEKFVQ